MSTLTSAGPCLDDAVPPTAAAGGSLLGGLFRAHRGRLLIAYALVTSENLLQLAQPWALGRAIDDLLRSSAAGLGLLTGLYVGYLLVGAARRSYDARAFTRIYADLATRLVLEQRRRAVDVSRVAARSALSREFVEFFQVYLPLVLQGAYSLAGAVAMLCLYDWCLMAACLLLVVPASVLNSFYSRQVLRLSARLHDELEQEVGVISGGDPQAVRGHYRRASFWRVKLADAEAVNTGVIGLFIVALLAVALFRSCTLPQARAGDIVAVFRYVLLFIAALDTLPLLIQHVSRLRDIGRRMRPGATDTPGPSS
jgi:hypothetical protein